MICASKGWEMSQLLSNSLESFVCDAVESVQSISVDGTHLRGKAHSDIL